MRIASHITSAPSAASVRSTRPAVQLYAGVRGCEQRASLVGKLMQGNQSLLGKFAMPSWSYAYDVTNPD
ncbi:MAG: hypothetical protein ACKVP7_23565 [Hyphomicrobiaceae bacterium]